MHNIFTEYKIAPVRYQISVLLVNNWKVGEQLLFSH